MKTTDLMSEGELKGEFNMKRSNMLLLVTILSFSAISFAQSSGGWVKILESEGLCDKESLSVWESDSASTALLYFESLGKGIPLVKELRHEEDFMVPRTYFISKHHSVPPAYEVRMTFAHESILPILKISYSGVQISCQLNWVTFDNANATKNVGSIGHSE